MSYFNLQSNSNLPGVHNGLVGTIPASLGNWSKLNVLLLGENNLEGTFPDTFEHNHMLGTIFIDSNWFNGTFPSVFSTLKNLQWLDAAVNDFTGTLPESIVGLKRLRILNVNWNHLNGSLPDTWDGDNVIEDLEVAYNDITGVLPVSLANARLLKDLRASNNSLTGSLPVEYYQLANLQELYLDRNMLGGELLQGAAPIYDGLQELSIHSNNFEGVFPVQHLEDTLRIKVLSLHRNKLTGTITANICDRADPSLSWSKLITLTVDCDENKMTCSCCEEELPQSPGIKCYKDGHEVVPGEAPSAGQ